MKTKLTRDIETCALKEFTSLGNFICSEVGIPIKKFGFPNKYYKYTNLSEDELINAGYQPNWYTDNEIVDILSWQSKDNIWKCYEIKVTYQDFKSKSAKTFVGNYNYYILPDTLLDKVINYIPKEIGVYVYKTEKPKYSYQKRLVCIKRAKKQDIKCEENILYYSLIKSLYREVKKLSKC